MTSTNDFIAEIIRAANRVERLGDTEKRRLLQRAVVTISKLRERSGIPSSNTNHDAVFALQAIEVTVERREAGEIKQALLMAADVIRTLHIVLDSGTQITTKVPQVPQ
ncbi:hypothetical protein SAMN02927900_05287 [Rhizobium mongolense subsp. loessense]|uniref:Uncharacterized protein n=1 Tax=Rhizobium mongolense subsp. loessense TaxID=158890 RepID=A0A1G4TLA7_9HYPH|nr:hypothetical protein [Rhizobium mongolense]SCW82121.1 hypothetical protein SAMN02927900_05287 [Rhizobium mongolense subsp. loessense]